MFHHFTLRCSSRTRLTRGKRTGHRFLLLILLFSLINPLQSQAVFAQVMPDPPVLLTPADLIQITATGESGTLATPPLAVPTFTWNPVPDTNVYRLEISQDIAFSTNVKTFYTPLTRYTPILAADFNDGTWYWRVRVDSPVASLFSPIRTFTKTWKSANNKPVLESPANNANLDFYDAPIFNWQPVLGAAYYRLQISRAYDFQPQNIIYNDFALTTQHRPAFKQVNGTQYYWRVIPIDPANREGTYSEVRTFNQGYYRVPVQLEPADYSTPTFTPTFRWTAVRGAQYYHLQYSTDPTFQSGQNNVITRNTAFTPTYTMENDVDVYWHVRAYSGISESAWSPTWRFMKQWYIKPVLLTPTDAYLFNRFPFFSWTPVPGAQYYRIQIDMDTDFVNCYIDTNTSNPFYTPERWTGIPETVYWRIIPYDGNGKEGKPSLPFSFYKSSIFTTPTQIHPLYYYPPNVFPEDPSVSMNPHEDRTVGLPIFIWNRLTDIASGEINAKSYRLQVSTISDFSNIVWEVTTENHYAVPQMGEFTPQNDVDYFWRVHGLDDVGGLYGTGWSQTWKARFNTSKRLSPTSSGVPQLLRPARASEIVDDTPLFEWFPYQGAVKYQIQISQDSSFNSGILLDSETPYPAFAPRQMLAQRNLNRLNFGTYYWHVRAYTSSWTGWSASWRFQIASQSEWTYTRTPGGMGNRMQIASDATGEPGINANYDLSTLYAAQDKDYWFFGFNAPSGAGDADFVLYLDTNHVDNSGATLAPNGYSISVLPAHRPEYALVIKKRSTTFTANNVLFYKWTGSAWNTPQTLAEIGGTLFYDSAVPFVELKVWNTPLGMNVSGGSYAMALFSLAVGAGAPLDITPTDPHYASTGTVSRFTSVSERNNLIYPFNSIEGDPTTHPSAPPSFWDYPSGSNGTHPWAGGKLENHTDPEFTASKGDFIVVSDTPYYSPTSHTWYHDLIGDNSYYWRFRTRNLAPELFSVWSQGWRFKRQGFVPQNLTESTVFATPTFFWSITEGAQSYDLQVASDVNFQNRQIDVNTTQNSYTPERTLPNGVYYWRVRIRRFGNVINEWTSTWSAPKTFELTLPPPDGLTPHDPSETNVIHTTPTVCWNPVIKSVGSIPVLAAWKYRVQINFGDPTFSPGSFYSEDIETEQNCYTSRNGFPDGKYYWRVAMLDGEGRPSAFSTVAEFTKQYPRTTLVSPLSGNVSQTPTFTWTPVNGAAYYRLQISQVPSYQPMYEEINTNQISFTPTRLYQTDKTYYWRVAIVDHNGRVGPYTDAIIYLNTNKVFLPFMTR